MLGQSPAAFMPNRGAQPGGWIRGTWLRLEPWVRSERTELGSPNVGEWWQWLVEVLEADPDPGKAVGTHIAYRNQRHAS